MSALACRTPNSEITMAIVVNSAVRRWCINAKIKFAAYTMRNGDAPFRTALLQIHISPMSFMHICQ
jgi:hypothetical protein